MKSYKFLSSLTFIISFLYTSEIKAQEQHEIDFPVDFHLQVKNAHLWRGLQVTNTAMIATDINYSKDGFKAGFWGGAGFTGVYKEFDYYISYHKKGFTVAVWDIYNFSSDATHNNTEFFNYSPLETGRFIDLTLGYQLQGKIPVRLDVTTIFFGRDRGISNKHNLYTTYVALGYPAIKHQKVNVDLGIAGAFTLKPEEGSRANFYAHKDGIVNLNLTFSKTLNFQEYQFPVSAMVMFNPVENQAHLQLAVNLF